MSHFARRSIDFNENNHTLVCNVPRRPKFIHPLRVVREALKKSQPQFAKIFGISASYLQAIELGQRKLTDELADAIMLRFGVDAESLKRKGGAPVHMIRSGKDRLRLWRGVRYVSQRAEAKEPFEEFAGLTPPRTIPGTGLRTFGAALLLGETWSNLPPPIDERERLGRDMVFWQRVIVSVLESDPRVMNALNNKLRLLLEAARREHKFYVVAMRLSRCIENIVREYGLRKPIDVIRNSLHGDAAKWPSFKETLAGFQLIKPHRRRHKR